MNFQAELPGGILQSDSQPALDELAAYLHRAHERTQLIPVSALHTACQSLAAFIAEHPDSQPGIALRDFLWSLWNDRHVINLYQFTCAVEDDLAESVALLFLARLRHALSDDMLRLLLTQAGEFERYQITAAGTPDDQDVQYPN